MKAALGDRGAGITVIDRCSSLLEDAYCQHLLRTQKSGIFAPLEPVKERSVVNSNSVALGRYLLAACITFVVCLSIGTRSASAAPTHGVRTFAASNVPHGSAASLEATICDIATEPVGKGINDLIRLISKGRIKTTIAGTLVAGVANQILCPAALHDLAKLLGLVAKRQPATRAELGPIVFRPLISIANSIYGPAYVFVTLDWSVIDPSSGIRYYKIYDQVNGGTWNFLADVSSPKYAHQFNNRGESVRWAISAVDWAQNQSPWVYTSPWRL